MDYPKKTIFRLSAEKEFLTIAEKSSEQKIVEICATVRELEALTGPARRHRKVTDKQRWAIALSLIDQFSLYELFEQAYGAETAKRIQRPEILPGIPEALREVAYGRMMFTFCPDEDDVEMGVSYPASHKVVVQILSRQGESEKNVLVEHIGRKIAITPDEAKKHGLTELEGGYEVFQ